MKRMTLGMAALGAALMLPEGAERGGLGLALGAILALGLLALAAWLLLGRKKAPEHVQDARTPQAPREEGR